MFIFNDLVFAFEIREYEPVLIAETTVDGDMSTASSSGFRLLADFIFGNSLVPGTTQAGKIAMTAPVTLEPQSAKIAMTAPVTVEPQSEKIAMTAPVTMSAASAEPVMTASNKWRVHFVMPSQYTLANIPQPKNSEVKLREIPGKFFAVNSYTGFNTQARVQAKTDELSAWVATQKMNALSSPQLSRYDPPWTLPMLRRNEIMIEIEAANAGN